MKKIGFIDYFIDEWHANNYPEFIRNSVLGNQFEIARAWEKLTPAGKIPLEQWCELHSVKKAGSIEEVVETCDCIVVLSPDNPEMHEELSDIPLRSGNPVYIDKTFAPTKEIAVRLFDKAKRYNTPLMSSSALRFESNIQNALKEELCGKKVHFASTSGSGIFDNYAVHQLEMLVMVLGTGAKKVMQCGNQHARIMTITYEDERRGSIQLSPSQPFRLACQYENDSGLVLENMTDFFDKFIEAMLRFFNTGESEIPKEETVEIISIYEAGIQALDKPDTWIEVPCDSSESSSKKFNR